MRKLIPALIVGLLVAAIGLGAGVQRAAAASSSAKVVIVVGATGSATSSYRSSADSAANTFAQYTSNIVKVYSPNATWAAVQSAAAGASILVYLGHGSGYPNPYNANPVAGDNGMGLNASAGNGDNNTQYYGASSMAQLGLATNAVVLLNHLCYASGDSEPGNGNPSLAVAQTRVDGYASGFLSGNARTVIAEGMGSLNPYIDALFNTHQTLDQMWKSYPGFHNHVTAWASTKNAGFTSQIDPNLDRPQSDGDVYYRSMVTIPSLSTDSVGQVKTYAATTFHPMSPARLLDTRAGNGLGGKLLANVPATFQVTGRGGIPANVTAVTGNVTVVNQSSGYALYLGPDATGSPGTSTINFNAGEAKGNSLTVALGSGGTLSATYMSTGGNTTDLVFDVTGYFTPDSTGATHHPTAPARLLDTRSGNGYGAKLASNRPITFQVSGRGGIPSNATAVTGNATVVNETNGWAIYLGPDSNPSPTTSSINFSTGQVTGNGLMIALGTGGSLSATYMSSSGNTTDLVFDVTGYFTQDSTGAKYVPLSPARLLDTRNDNGLSGKFGANTPRTFPIWGRAGIPGNSTAVTGNITVVNQTSGYAAYLGPDPVASPSTSTINFSAGEVKGNSLTVALSSGGTLSATYMSTPTMTTDLVFDVTGYFAP